MSAAPDVSIVIPSRDRWELLSRHALPSALSQESVELEVVVVDDGSEDPVSDRIAEFDDLRLRVVRHDIPRRLPGARNAGAEVACGNWLAFLDDDDVWSPRKLRAQLDTACASGSAWAYGRAVVVDGSLTVIESDPFPEPTELAGLLLGGNWVPGGGSNVIVRADAFAAAGGFDEELRFFEDWDLWLRLLDAGLPAACDEVVMARVEHGANMVVRDRERVASAFERVLAKRRVVTDADRKAVNEWLAFEQHRAGDRLGASRLYLRTVVSCRSPGNLVPAVGALFGTRGMELASRLLVATRGVSHLDVERRAPPTE
ncbi:MAG: glycosyltransferase, partial [Thermoleophilia bacterium]|nr:glycosyltransferase [Thermoleophilia bacterium]